MVCVAHVRTCIYIFSVFLMGAPAQVARVCTLREHAERESIPLLEKSLVDMASATAPLIQQIVSNLDFGTLNR